MGLKDKSDEKHIKIKPLTDENPCDLKKFKCEDSDFNQFIYRKARKHQDSLIAKTYLLYYDDEIAGFFTLSCASIIATTSIKLEYQNGKKYNDYPAVRIGRLAVSESFSKKGFASHMLDQIKAKLAFGDNVIAGRYLIVDSKCDKVKLYEDNGFSLYTDEDEKDKTRLMYFDLMKMFQQ